MVSVCLNPEVIRFNPDKVRSTYGADATRLYISFMGPFDKDKPWSDTGIEGCRRFLDRIWRLMIDDQGRLITNHNQLSSKLNILLHQTIKKVTEDIESLNFNTAISAMMILVNEMYLDKSHNHNALKNDCATATTFCSSFGGRIVA